MAGFLRILLLLGNYQNMPSVERVLTTGGDAKTYELPASLYEAGKPTTKPLRTKKWVSVNKFIVNDYVYSTWPHTTLAVWGSENRVALLSLPLFAPSGRYPPGNLLPEVRGRGVHPARGWAPPHGRLLLLGRGSLGYRGVRGVSHEKHAWVWGALSQRTRVRHKRNYKWQTFFQRYSGFSGWLIYF